MLMYEDLVEMTVDSNAEDALVAGRVEEEYQIDTTAFQMWMDERLKLMYRELKEEKFPMEIIMELAFEVLFETGVRVGKVLYGNKS